MAPPTTDPEQSIWLSLPMVAAIVLALAVAKLYVAAHIGLAYDEGYYTFWSERLATGYLDHPPAVAVMIAVGRALVGDSELGVRLLAVLSSLCLSVLIYRLGVLLLDRPAAALAVLWYNFAPVAGLDFITTPDPPSALFWTATLWAVAEFIASRRPAWWLIAGIMAGLGLWSKYTLAFLAVGLPLFILTSRERREWLRLWQVWAGAVLALLVFSPVIWWNAERNWISFLFQGQRTVTEGVAPDLLGNLGDFLAGQALYMMPVLFGFAIAGIVMFLRRPSGAARGLALPVLTGLPALAYFLFHTVHDKVEANWLIPLWPALSLAAAHAATALWRRRSALFAAASVVQLVLGLGLTGFVYVQALYRPFDLGVLDRTNETRGWPQLEQKLQGLAAANGARWIATRHEYALTGELASYATFARSPLLVRQIDEPLRWAFLPPFDPDAAGWPALFVRLEPNPAAPRLPTDLFGDAKLVEVFQRDGGRTPLESWSAFVVSRPTAKFWAGLRG